MAQVNVSLRAPLDDAHDVPPSEAEHPLLAAIDDHRTRDPDGDGAVAVMTLIDLPRVRARIGADAIVDLMSQVTGWITAHDDDTRIAGLDDAGNVVLFIAPGRPMELRMRLEHLARDLAVTTFDVQQERLHVTPAIGLTVFGESIPTGTAVERARRASLAAAARLDLTPTMWTPSLDITPIVRAPRSRARRSLAWALPSGTAAQIALTFLIGLGAPYLLFTILGGVGLDFTGPVYDALVIAFVTTAAAIWVECLLALDPPRPPRDAVSPYARASAIIAAYLPNESATIAHTIEAFLALEYPGDLEIILAYNTPRPLPIEHELREMAERDPRLTLLRVEGSTSKAQNVNAALGVITGEMVGIFDADHHPGTHSFERAWRWISAGADIVQGHCVVRNGRSSWVGRLVAVEFESIYAVSHPGRALFHNFGVFGGTNGYWRTTMLRQVRMSPDMLTEDIDSSVRALERGARIVSDPALQSRELAPLTLKALFHQRMRWAQGWFQVSLKHTVRVSRSPNVSPRQKAGLWFLLGWGQMYPWVGLQIISFLAYLGLHQDGGRKMYWFIPLFVATSLFTISVGPAQTVFAYLLATPEIRRHRAWFVAYLLLASLFYTEFKNVITRVAHLKQLRGESHWRVTARSHVEPQRTLKEVA